MMERRQDEQNGPEVPRRQAEDICYRSLGLIDQNREYLQMHLAGKADRRTTEALEDIEIESARLERTIRETMGLLALWEGETSPCWFDLDRLLEGFGSMREEIARQTGVELGCI